MEVKSKSHGVEYLSIHQHISVTMQHRIVSISLISVQNMFRLYTAIIRCPRHVKLLTVMLVVILTLKLKLQLKFNINRSPYYI
jgi:hypothetical protein